MSSAPDAADLTGAEVLVAVSGGIAAYKVGYVVSELVQRGVGVSVAMTESATKLVGPATFEALSGRPVITSMWTSQAVADVRHIRATEEADLMLIAPATANMIGKVAAGIADDFVSTAAISMAEPAVLAPAMNDRMWANPAVQENVAKLRRRGHLLIGPAEGWLACRSAGPGRMAEPRDIVDAIAPMLTKCIAEKQAGRQDRGAG